MYLYIYIFVYIYTYWARWAGDSSDLGKRIPHRSVFCCRCNRFRLFSKHCANLSLAAAKPEFGNCQTRVWQLPRSLATAKLGFGSCQRVWQLPNPILAAAKEFGNCQTRFWQPPNPSLELPNGLTRVWQLPKPILAAAKTEFGSCQTRTWQLPNLVVKLWFGSC
jgi:hypothetical protein